jgi:hypothetical protein
MSRAERRAYERMTRNRDPMAPPPLVGAARARREALRARRATAAAQRDPTKLFSRRALWFTFGGAFGVGLLGLSLAWPSGAALAVAIGAVVGVAWAAVSIGFLAMRRRSALRSGQGNAASGERGRRPAGR